MSKQQLSDRLPDGHFLVDIPSWMLIQLIIDQPKIVLGGNQKPDGRLTAVPSADHRAGAVVMAAAKVEAERRAALRDGKTIGTAWRVRRRRPSTWRISSSGR
jgi:hypothetical protein